jgi:hypothetical protein
MLKDYLGEKVAYEQAFLLHYIGWLIYPSILGIALTVYQSYKYFNLPKKDRTITNFLDTEYNAVYGIIVAMWATVFVESWKNN